MAHTAHQDEDSMEELFDEQEELEESAKKLAEWIRNSKHCIIFTGAGVSTSAGIPDFRGPDGAWTLKAQGRTRTEKATDISKAVPTPTHMAIVALLNHGLAKYVISQNVDGLHLKSGVHPSKISELHGNSNLEVCTRCGKEYLRDYPVRRALDLYDHKTGQFCDMPECNGTLVDTLVNFNEQLPETPLVNGIRHSKEADLCLVLGSSLTVSPACKMPELVGKSLAGRLVICNLQRTPLDTLAKLRIHARCDELMTLVMKELAIEIPHWKLSRVLEIEHKFKPDGLWSLHIRTMDVEGTPSSYIKTLSFWLPEGQYKKAKFFANADNAEHTFDITERQDWRKDDEESGVGEKEEALDVEVLLRLGFYQYYLEPDVQLVYNIDRKSAGTAGRRYLLEYDPRYRKFAIVNSEDRSDVTALVGRGPSIMGSKEEEEDEQPHDTEGEQEYILVRKLSRGNPLVLKAAPVSVITHVKDQTDKKDTLTAMKPRTVCVVGCSACEYVIQGPLLKLVLESCKDTSVSIDGTVISGVVEVINCKGMQLFVNKNVPTLQIDGTESCAVVFEHPAFVTNIYTAKSKDINTCVKDTPSHLVECSDGSWENDQYITRMRGDQWETERVVRCSGGYATTEGEIAEYEEKERKFDAAMSKFVAETFGKQL